VDYIMLDVSACEEYFVKTLDHARQIGKLNQLLEQLHYLATYANRADKDTQCCLFQDHAPWSFQFEMKTRESPNTPWESWFPGGLILHGAHDAGGVTGGAPTFSCTLSPVDGWQVHT
jgi:hypothetical protein